MSTHADDVYDYMPAEPGYSPTVRAFKVSDFEDPVQIGKGKDSIIYAATCYKLGGKVVALKVYERSKLSSSKMRAIRREISIMNYVTQKKIPWTIQFHGVMCEDDYICVVMEHCSAGDLLEQLLRTKKPMTEGQMCRDVAIPMLTCLTVLHALDIIHRDIKLENIFLTGEHVIKLGDFGLTMSTRQELAISPVGTVEYMAPEVVALPPSDMVHKGFIRKESITPTNEKVDIWALGVTCYELVTGWFPFDGADKAEIKKAILDHRMRPFPGQGLSPQAISFIKAMLSPNPDARPSAEALMNHVFVQSHLHGTPLLKAPTRRGVALQVRAGPPTKAGKKGPKEQPSTKDEGALPHPSGGSFSWRWGTRSAAVKGESRPAGSTPQGSPQLVKAAGVVQVNSSRTEDVSCARAGLWEAARRFLMQRLGFGKTSKGPKGPSVPAKAEGQPAVHA